MSSALGMNLMPPTSAFQHGLQQAAAAAAAAAAQAASVASQQPQQTASNETDEHPTSQESHDLLNDGTANRHAAAKLAANSSGKL